MSTLNFSPKNPLLILGLAGAAMWLLTSRRVSYAGAVRPSAVGASTVNGGGLNGILQAVGSIFGTRSTGSTGSTAEDARAAVRAGDPYYGDDGYGLTGSVAGWYTNTLSDAEAWRIAMAGVDNPTGDPYNSGW